MKAALREDALSATPYGFELRIGLPWIRALPLAGVSHLAVAIDGVPVPPDDVRVILGRRRIAPATLAAETEHWWWVQDRLVLAADRALTPGAHAVAVEFRLAVPHLAGGPEGPLIVPIYLVAELELDGRVASSVARDVA